jgi:hypothetical protein
MSEIELRQLRNLLIKAIDHGQIVVGDSRTRVPVVDMEYKAGTRQVLLKLGRPHVE